MGNKEKTLARQLIEKIISGKVSSVGQLNLEKARISAKLRLSKILRNSDILKYASAGERDKVSILVKKPVRTLSGVAIVAVMAKPSECPGKCIYCPQGENAPKSYTGKEPAARRAKMFDYDPFVQITKRLQQLKAVGHSIDKVELIIMGGTFLSRPKSEQVLFVKRCFDALNGSDSSTIGEAQKLNETAKSRCVGLTVETRPDYCKKEDINTLLELGATRVELGVQSLSDDVYRKIKRGHTIDDVVKATRFLKDSGFKVVYHMMPGLLQNQKQDIAMFRKLFRSRSFRPDMLKIYPTLVVSGTGLYNLWKEKKYAPLQNEEATDLVSRIKEAVPLYCRIMRVQRDIPAGEIAAGVTAGNLRELAQEKLKARGLKCKCIRCREVGHSSLKSTEFKNPELFVEKYDASGGQEYFISFEDKNRELLYGYLRLRMPSNPFRKELAEKTSIVRELKVFGTSVPLGGHPAGAIQHKGIGRKLMKKAEAISGKERMKKIAVIAAVGTKEYYRALGYSDDGAYVSKGL
ncbi:Uncharacterised protein [uncultured archaeon]|nr:Uncharacterised protein [uncultured archaeon]